MIRFLMGLVNAEMAEWAKFKTNEKDKLWNNNPNMNCAIRPRNFWLT